MKATVSIRTMVSSAAALSLVLAGCGASSHDSTTEGLDGTLRIFAYTDAFEPEVFDPFVDANPGLEIDKAEIGGDTEAVAKLKGGFQTDIVNTCAGPIDQEIADGSLQPIDTSRIDDWDKIYDFFKNVDGVQVDGSTFMVPMVGGVYGLVYRPSVFDTAPTSWMDYYTADVKVGAVDDPLTNIITAGLALNKLPPQMMTSGDLSAVKDLLLQQKAHVPTYITGDAESTLWQNGEIDLIASDVELVNTVGDDIAFAPMPTPLAWTCGFSIASTAENLDAAYAYLEYALSPAVQAVQAESFSYLVSNTATAQELPAEVSAATGQDDVASYRDAATFNTPSDMDSWTQLWQEVKAQ